MMRSELSGGAGVGCSSCFGESTAPLQARIGIATGLVIVGDPARRRSAASRARRRTLRRGCKGSPNRTRWSSLRARAGFSAICSTLRASEPRTSRAPEPVQTWTALRASSVASRFEALHTAGLTALVGREEELELVLRRWSKAKTDEGQVVLLSGEAGIGKSRLTAALLESIASEPHTRLRYFCSPQHTDSAFYPIMGQMERAAGFAHDDAPEAKLGKPDALLAQTSTSEQDAALFAEICRCRTMDGIPRSTYPEQRRQQTLEALFQMEARSANSGTDDFRGCALDRPYEPGSVRPGSGSDWSLRVSVDCYFPARI